MFAAVTTRYIFIIARSTTRWALAILLANYFPISLLLQIFLPEFELIFSLTFDVRA